MIVLDTSVLYAILAGEADAPLYQDAMAHWTEFCMSTPTWVEASMVCRSRLPDGMDRLRGLVRLLGIERHPLDVAQADLATEAFVRFGRGSGSPARLNLGDCFSYALARTLDAPLLYKGDDFRQTDVLSALDVAA